MKKYILLIIKILIFIICFGAGFYYFMPWQDIGRFSLLKASTQLEQKGFRVAWSNVEPADSGFTVNNLTLNGAANISLESITIKPKILLSILSLSGVCDIRFRNAKIMLGQSFSLGDGSVIVSASFSEILLEQLRTRGDIGINGDITIDTSGMKISKANASLSIPSSLESAMGLIQNFLPLVNEGGRWFLRR